MMRRLLILIVFCFPFASIQAQRPGEQPAETWRQQGRVTSHLKNVVVTSMPKEIALEVAIWAESVIESIEKWTRSSIPGNYTFPIVIRAEERPDEKQGFVITSQYVSDDGHIRQRITIVNRKQVDREDLLEGFCHLLFNRWIHVRQTREQLNQQVGEFPHWFTYGMAQSLFTKLVNRNYDALVEEEKRGNYAPALSVIHQHVLPPGRWPEKARAGLVMKWLSSEVSPDELLRAAADTVATQQPLDEAFVSRMLGVDSPKTVNASWDLWMARQSNRFMPAAASTDLDGIIRILSMRADDLGLAHPAIDGAGNIPIELLIDERDMPWVQDVCKRIIWKLQLETVGKTKAIQDRVVPFLAFYAQMLNEPARIAGLNIEPGNRSLITPSRRSFKKVWNAAMKDWQALLAESERRETYIDAFQADSSGNASNVVKDWLNQWETQNP